jgi:hypothetical protein
MSIRTLRSQITGSVSRTVFKLRTYSNESKVATH